MNDPGNSTMNQRQIDSRDNLFFLLRTLSATAHAPVHKAPLNSSITNEQIEIYINRSGVVS
jgi:hypothetical protein